MIDYTTFTQEDFYQWVDPYQDQYREGEVGYGEVTDFTWGYQQNFPLLLLGDSMLFWATWFQQEKQLWAKDGDPTRYDDLATWWEPTEFFIPVIIVEGIDSFYYPWDGCHRIGASCCADQYVAPAIVGKRKE